MKISMVGEGVEWKYAHSPKALNELNPALPRLPMGQIKKYFYVDTFYLNKKRLNRQKITISHYCPFNVYRYQTLLLPTYV